MANFSSLIPKTPLKRVITATDGTLKASAVHLAAAWKPVSGEEFYRCHHVHGEPGLSLHSNGIRQQSTISNAGDLTLLFHHLLGVNRSNKSVFSKVQSMSYKFVADAHVSTRSGWKTQEDRQAAENSSKKEHVEAPRKHQLGENIPKKDKIKFLVNTLLDIRDSKEAVYGALDVWVAWERSFPMASLKRVIALLEKEHQWHRVIQVIKWMLSKGQGNTMGTYGQLVRALDMDRRAEEAHCIWQKKIGKDLHSVPWQLCRQMISIYHRNNMLEELVKLFKNLESFDRKPPDKAIVQRVADAYEMLGMLKEKERVLAKYSDLFNSPASIGISSKASSKNKSSPGHGNSAESTSGDAPDSEKAGLQERQREYQSRSKQPRILRQEHSLLPVYVT
ncbi:PREDICTED: pentatricopeptide repeat-containing protein At4g18975, chloroplastic-like [Tarenaya hassleriana]|uniref:pentatricopeptide repeat-containing protein At4g18975, chloroplastic-like n=1 Tax=Tarenaya hassleriana TaxID=28532 RepID=UPI00053C4244|nr:PREDICTED: pentatricopeptide repeat-containing protein At4g18975, chloroplastic-like [Tarenaya hassleriana]